MEENVSMTKHVFLSVLWNVYMFALCSSISYLIIAILLKDGILHVDNKKFVSNSDIQLIQI